jgi:hypothetical protein
MRPKDAFDVCHEVYVHAREVLEQKLGTINPELSSKYLWRPDNRPKLAEYVADFALAGERALGGRSRRGPSAKPLRVNSKGAGRPLASRLILFRVHYLGGAPYERARKHLGISELAWSQWAEEVRERVGRELIRVGVYPPGRYFKEPTRGR